MTSYEQQVKTARRRIKRLRSEGIDNFATKQLEAELSVFYKRSGLKKRGYGVSIDSRMTSAQKREMSMIIRSFLRNPTSTLTGIKEEAKNITGETLTAKEAAQVVDESGNFILSDKAISESLASDILKDVYNHQKALGYDPDYARSALSTLVLSGSLNGKGMDVSGVSEMVKENIIALMEQGLYD